MSESLSRRALVGTVLVLLLGGCFYDSPPPRTWYHNNTDSTIVVTITEPGVPYEQPVDGGDSVAYSLDECRGTSLVVKTEGGVLMGVVEEPACPGWELTVDADGSVDYAKK